MNDYFAFFLAGLLAGIGLTIQVLLFRDIVRASRLIGYYLRTRDRRRAVELFERDLAKRLKSR